MGSYKDECPVGLKETYRKFMGQLFGSSNDQHAALNEIFGDVGDIDKVYENGQPFVKSAMLEYQDRGTTWTPQDLANRAAELAKLEAGLD